MSTDLKVRCQAVEVGRLGEMKLFVSKRPHIKWPAGSLGLVLKTNPFKIFSKNMDWTVDPRWKHPKRVTFSEDEQGFILKHNKEVAYLMEHDFIKDPLEAYLFMGNLLLSGFRPHVHSSWASYLINNVGTMLYSEPIYQQLLEP